MTVSQIPRDADAISPAWLSRASRERDLVGGTSRRRVLEALEEAEGRIRAEAEALDAAGAGQGDAPR